MFLNTAREGRCTHPTSNTGFSFAFYNKNTNLNIIIIGVPIESFETRSWRAETRKTRPSSFAWASLARDTDCAAKSRQSARGHGCCWWIQSYFFLPGVKRSVWWIFVDNLHHNSVPALPWFDWIPITDHRPKQDHEHQNYHKTLTQPACLSNSIQYTSNDRIVKNPFREENQKLLLGWQVNTSSPRKHFHKKPRTATKNQKHEPLFITSSKKKSSNIQARWCWVGSVADLRLPLLRCWDLQLQPLLLIVFHRRHWSVLFRPSRRRRRRICGATPTRRRIVVGCHRNRHRNHPITTMITILVLWIIMITTRSFQVLRVITTTDR